MEIVRTGEDLNRILEKAVGPVGFVPTMGALHDGHISLVEAARKENGTVVASIFVNPTQFNDPEDLRNYPRTPEEDLRKLEAAGTDIVFMPEPEEIYPEPDSRVFDFGSVAEVMEGATRPGHFNGVGQVVSRLFEMVRPDKAYFGEKDFQQVAVVRKLNDLTGCGVGIVVCPTVREADGLAMSSRNALLGKEYRKAAPSIYRALQKGVELYRENKAAGGSLTPREVEQRVTDLINSERLLEVVYFKIVDAGTMQEAGDWRSENGLQGCVAVRAGNVRLIDNIRFE